MTDKERIEELEKEIKELPNRIIEMAMNRIGACMATSSVRDDTILLTKLKVIFNDVLNKVQTQNHSNVNQNQKAVEALERFRNHLKDLRDLEISAVRESREFNFTSEDARLKWVESKTESSKIYNNEIKFIDQLIKEYGGKE